MQRACAAMRDDRCCRPRKKLKITFPTLNMFRTKKSIFPNHPILTIDRTFDMWFLEKSPNLDLHVTQIIDIFKSHECQQ
jgi:hypothetical protein